MVGKTPFHLFAKNTKQTCMLICISLFIIIIVSVFNSKSIHSKLLMFSAVLLLSYCFYTNVKETAVLYNSMEENDIVEIRKNILMSYAFSSVLMLFIVYILYTMVF